MKALGAAAASSGAVALCHIVGVTPEAPSLEAAFQGRRPAQTLDITMDDLRQARRELTHWEDGQLDLVALGCPHFSLAEFERLASLVSGKRIHPDVQLLVASNRTMALLAEKAGCLAVLEGFGARLIADTCILASPMLPPDVSRMMTNSAKYAYYAPGLLNVRVAFGSLEDCVRSAVTGHVVTDGALWGM